MFSVHHGLAGFRAIEPHWRQLTAHDERYWLHFAFFDEALRCLPNGAGDCRTFVYHDAHGEALAIVPVRMTDVSIRRLTFRCAELIGSTYNDVTSQFSSVDFPAVSQVAADDAVRAVVHALHACAPRPSLLLMGRLAHGSKALHAALCAHPRREPHLERGGSKWIDVNRPFASLQHALSRKFRAGLRSALRNLSQAGVVEFGTTSRLHAAFDEEFRTFLRIESSGWKGSEGTGTGLLANTTTSQRDLLSAVANRADAPLAEIHWLKVNDRCIASQLWLRAGGMRAALKIGYLEEFSHFQPGHLLVEHVLRDSCADPVLHTVDFVSDAAWLDKWRVALSPWYYHYVPVHAVAGRVADLMLRLPSRAALPSLASLRHAVFRSSTPA